MVPFWAGVDADQAGEAYLQLTAHTVAAEKQLHQHIRQELETYAQELEAWLNQPGQSPEQQHIVAALAAEMRDTFTRTVLTRMQLTNAHFPSLWSKRQNLPSSSAQRGC